MSRTINQQIFFRRELTYVLIVVTCIWATFDLLVLNAILWSFGAIVSKWPVIRKFLAVE